MGPPIPKAAPLPSFDDSDFMDSVIGDREHVLDRVAVTSSVPLNDPPAPSSIPDPFPVEPITSESNERVARYRMLVPICDELDALNMELFVQFGHLLLSAQNKRQQR
jgi:hypothetical protein